MVIFLLIGWWGQIVLLGEIPLYRDDTRTYVFNAIARENAQYIPSVMMFWNQPFAKDHSLAICNDENLYTSYAATTKPNTEICCCMAKGAFYSTLLRLANSYGIQRDDGIYIDIALTNQELAEFLCHISGKFKPHAPVSYEN